ncbi:MAG TPA: hypothetical protein VGQ25_09465 [Gemmatimonadales bacterium]|jgi:hypothetical protein|nr:hypothetical protein [Gemmatimonadales bacterium]
MLIAVVLIATVLLRFTIVTAAVYLLLPRGPACPRCGVETGMIRHPVLRRLLPALEHRWCLECGWNGLARRGGRRPQSRVISRTARS